MRRYLMLLILLIFCSCERQVKNPVKKRREAKVITGTGIERLDNRYGLEEFEFETSPDEYDNIELDEDASSYYWKTYKKMGGPNLGFLTSDSISYNFYEDKLYSIDIYGHAYDEYKFYNSLSEVYGPATSRDFSQNLIWEGQRVRMLVKEIKHNDGIGISNDNSDYKIEITSLIMDRLFEKQKEEAEKSTTEGMKDIL
ncbi:hypothetical protein [Rufibacter sp. DG15C]|uniref:hypothetical protein n=1 Tax=Rufibacter sp. DG15C TaxID=1379909 RepID=UPI0012FB3AE4|nr:hypothetical protein [Rufibacter sp. DG15C]